LPTVQRSSRVTYSAEQMFDLVADVEKYPEFLHWCSGARIDERHGNTIEATLDIGVLGLRRSFRTRDTLRRPDRISIELVSGPFRRLRGEWKFADLAAGGSEVSLSLAFEVTVSPFGVVFSKMFEEVAGAQMDAFTARAAKLYGAVES
jgi:ribosome-associated toxin RatA of RatAB toxin-antitoxin module